MAFERINCTCPPMPARGASMVEQVAYVEAVLRCPETNVCERPMLDALLARLRRHAEESRDAGGSVALL